jgi:hypothetical protein
MAPSCSLRNNERYARLSIGAGLVLGGFLLHRDPLTGIVLVTTGTAVAAAAALGY